jgi:hypothetical protein
LFDNYVNTIPGKTQVKKPFPKIVDTLLSSQALTPTPVIAGIPAHVLSAIIGLSRQS